MSAKVAVALSRESMASAVVVLLLLLSILLPAFPEASSPSRTSGLPPSSLLLHPLSFVITADHLPSLRPHAGGRVGVEAQQGLVERRMWAGSRRCSMTAASSMGRGRKPWRTWERRKATVQPAALGRERWGRRRWEKRDVGEGGGGAE